MVRALGLRSARLWAGVRGMAALYLAVNDLSPFPSSLAAAFFFVIVTTTACLADVWVRREWVLMGNLGVSLRTVGVASAVPAILAEVCFTAAARLLS